MFHPVALRAWILKVPRHPGKSWKVFVYFSKISRTWKVPKNEISRENKSIVPGIFNCGSNSPTCVGSSLGFYLLKQSGN